MQSTPKVILTAEDIQVRLGRAYLNGDGEGVFEIWRLIADGKLHPKSKALWLEPLSQVDISWKIIWSREMRLVTPKALLNRGPALIV